MLFYTAILIKITSYTEGVFQLFLRPLTFQKIVKSAVEAIRFRFLYF